MHVNLGLHVIWSAWLPVQYMHSARVLTQVSKQLDSQCCKNEEEKHEEKTQIPHLHKDNRKNRDLSEKRNPREKQTTD